MLRLTCINIQIFVYIYCFYNIYILKKIFFTCRFRCERIFNFIIRTFILNSISNFFFILYVNQKMNLRRQIFQLLCEIKSWYLREKTRFITILYILNVAWLLCDINNSFYLWRKKSKLHVLLPFFSKKYFSPWNVLEKFSLSLTPLL